MILNFICAVPWKRAEAGGVTGSSRIDESGADITIGVINEISSTWELHAGVICYAGVIFLSVGCTNNVSGDAAWT